MKLRSPKARRVLLPAQTRCGHGLARDRPQAKNSPCDSSSRAFQSAVLGTDRYAEPLGGLQSLGAGKLRAGDDRTCEIGTCEIGAPKIGLISLVARRSVSRKSASRKIAKSRLALLEIGTDASEPR